MVYTTKLSLGPFRKTDAGIDTVLVLALQEYDDHGTAPLPNVCVPISRLTSKVLTYVYLKSKRKLAHDGPGDAGKHGRQTFSPYCREGFASIIVIYARTLVRGWVFAGYGSPLLPLLRENVRPGEPAHRKPREIP